MRQESHVKSDFTLTGKKKKLEKTQIFLKNKKIKTSLRNKLFLSLPKRTLSPSCCAW